MSERVTVTIRPESNATPSDQTGNQTKHNQKFLLFHSLDFLIRSSNSEMLSWPNSPLLVMLQFVDSSVMSGDEDAASQQGEAMKTPLHHLTSLADPSVYSTHKDQLILAKQRIVLMSGNKLAIVALGRIFHIFCKIIR
jgi:hypothetical protein